MSKTHAVPALLVLVGLSIAAPACASQRGIYVAQRDSRDFERRAYDEGYRDGLRNGERDARDRREFRIERDRDYRDADEGYRGYGDRGRYRREFREGYRAGYTQGYNRVARFEGRRAYPPIGAYPDGRGVDSSPAARIGYRDGYEAGRDDARDRDAYDPRRSKRFRQGDHDYNDRYGSREEYKREYRAAFESGYALGYRESRR